MIVKLNERTGMFLWMLGLVIAPYVLRDRFIPQIVAVVNVVSICGVLLIAKKHFVKRKGWSQAIFYSLLFAAFFLMLLKTRSPSTIFKRIVCNFFPLILLDMKCLDRKRFEETYSIILKVITVSIGLIAACAVVDVATGWRVSKAIANLYGADSLGSMVRDSRLVSYFGHSLVTTEVVLIFYILHIINEFYVIKRYKMVWQTIVSVFLIALTGSKTGLVLIVALIMLVYGNRKMLKYIPVLCLVVLVGYQMGVFDKLLERLISGLESGDITTGRISAFIKMRKMGVLDFHWFSGHSSAMYEKFPGLIAALENPILRWAYNSGIAFAIVMTLLVFVIPVLKMLKYKDMRLLLAALIYIVDVNTYDTVCSLGDSMLRYCTVIYIITSAMNYVFEEKR